MTVRSERRPNPQNGETWGRNHTRNVRLEILRRVRYYGEPGARWITRLGWTISHLQRQVRRWRLKAGRLHRQLAAQRRLFTWDEIDMLRAIAKERRRLSGDEIGGGREVDELADKVASFLPPRRP